MRRRFSGNQFVARAVFGSTSEDSTPASCSGIVAASASGKKLGDGLPSWFLEEGELSSSSSSSPPSYPDSDVESACSFSDEEISGESCSSAGLSTSATSTTPELAPSQTGTRLVDLACLQALVEAICICKFCKEGSVEVVESQRTGLASSVLVRCPLCSACSEVDLMPKAGRFYECNRRSVVAAG